MSVKRPEGLVAMATEYTAGVEIVKLIGLRKKYLAQMFAETERLANIFYERGADQVFLFGSLTNDGVYLDVFEKEAILGSDIDMAVVTRTPALEAARRALQFLTEEVVPQFPLDLVVFTPAELDNEINQNLLKGAVAIAHGEGIPVRETDNSIILDRSVPRQFGCSR